MRTCCRFAAAGMMALCLFAFLPRRSLASARSLLRYGSSCWSCCLVVPSVPCRHRSSFALVSFDLVKAFQSMRFSIQSSIGCVRRCHVIQFHRVRHLSACPSRHLPRRSVPRLRADGAMLGSASRSPRRLAARFPFPRHAILPDGRGGDGVVLSLACLFASSDLWRCPRAGVRFLSLGRVRCHDACGELTGTARVPMIG